MSGPVGSRRAIVHVGLPRTGTTTLQRVLSGMRTSLLGQGILYPDLTPVSASQPHLSHQYLGEALDGRRSRQDRAELLDALSIQLATTDADIAVVSYEGLCLAPAWLGVPKRLAALFAARGFAMEVLVTLKPQDELVNSTYTWRTQFLRERRVFRDFFHAEIGQARLDLARLLRSWQAACGGRICAVPTKDARSDRPLVERILAETGLLPRLATLIDADDLTLVDNRSPGPVVVEVSRQLRQGGAHLSLGSAVRDVIRFVEAAAQARGLDATPFRGLDAPLRAEAAARWGRANDLFAKAVWGEAWSARVASQLPSASNEIARSGDVWADVDEILRETCEHYQLRLSTGIRLVLYEVAASAGSTLGQLAQRGRAMAF